MNESVYEDARMAAEVHRQTRAHINNFIKPGMLLVDIANEIENTVRRIGDAKGLNGGKINLNIYLLLFNIVHIPYLQ